MIYREWDEIMRPGSPVVTYECEILGETDKAIKFSFVSKSGDMLGVRWVPLSQVSQIHRTYSVVNDTLDSIVISTWIAEKLDLGEEID